jgi:pimeloyl-ACP methyl ester carboxylesterase
MFMTTINYRTTDVEGLKVFYREAGRADAPMLLLLHGFPSAGHMFRDLIPQLADRFHVIAPDLPGFGQSDMPERTNADRIVDQYADREGARHCYSGCLARTCGARDRIA